MKRTNERMDLRILRKAKGWSQQQVADRAGISRSYIGMMETCGRAPSVTVAHKLAHIYGIKWYMLFDKE